jgi:hypothetical protein
MAGLSGVSDGRAQRIAQLEAYLRSAGILGGGGGLAIPSRPLSAGPGSASGAPSGEGVSGSGSTTGMSGSGFSGSGPTGPTGAITGFDASLVGQGLGFLGSAVPGVSNVASVFGNMGPTAANLAGVGSSLTQSTPQGDVSIANLNNSQGIFGSLMSGQMPTLANLANNIGPTLAAMINGPQFAQVGQNGGELSMASNANAMQEAQAGRTALGGQVGGFGPQGGFDSAAVGKGVLSGDLNAFTGLPQANSLRGQPDPSSSSPGISSNDPGVAAAGNVAGVSDTSAAVSAAAAAGVAGQGISDTSGSGGGGGGGGSHICGALYRRGLLTREDLAANELYRRRMTPAEYAGYSRWALPLVRFADTHPRAGRMLTATLGRVALCYMREIRAPGSSRAGALILRLALPICRRLGARAIARRAIAR